MIIKDKSKNIQHASSAQAKAGIKQELDVAFYLRRAFKDHEKVFVFNDLKFSHKQETAQIDHLILYPYGFALIESKSITGEVKVNGQEEWARSYNSVWKGMPSPIKQVELQQQLFRELLFEHRSEMLGKVLFMSQAFGGRCWDNLCAISSNAIIDRDNMPSKISKQLVKSEFIVEKLNGLMKLRNKFINPINGRPSFSELEMDNICRFILSQDITNKPYDIEKSLPKNSAEDIASVVKEIEVRKAPRDLEDDLKVTPLSLKPLQLICKKCGLGPKLKASYGKYGYFTTCSNCSVNTSMKQSCPTCESKKIQVSKKGDVYTLNCLDCQLTTSLII